MVALAESCLGGNLGASITLKENSLLSLFGEGLGQILASVNPDQVENFEEIFSECSPIVLGQVSNDQQLKVSTAKEVLIEQSLNNLSKSFKSKF